MALTTREAFKTGFLLRAAEEGCDASEILQRVKTAREKLAAGAAAAAGAGLGIGSVLSGAGKVVGELGLPALLGAALLPPAVGAAGGYAAAKLTDVDDLDVEEARSEEVRSELERLRERALMSAAARRFRLQGRQPSGRRLLN